VSPLPPKKDKNMTSLAISMIAASYIGALAVGFIFGVYGAYNWSHDDRNRRRNQ
jgi:hypothetical protein